MPPHILVAEDQADIRDLLVMNLRGAGYQVAAVADGAAALASQAEQRSDLLILDLMMPALDGLEVCKALRARGHGTPILMLTAKSTELDRVLGLELGADDYLTKPFSLAELLARVKALLRRAEMQRAARPTAAQPRVLRNGSLEIEPAKRLVRHGGRPRWTSPRWSSTCCCTLPSTRGMCSRARSCSMRSGATATTATSTPSPRTSTACATSSRPTRCARSCILTVRGAGYKMRERRRPLSA